MATNTSHHIAQTPTLVIVYAGSIQRQKAPGLQSLEVSRTNYLREHQIQPADIHSTKRAEIQSRLIHHHGIHKHRAPGPVLQSVSLHGGLCGACVLDHASKTCVLDDRLLAARCRQALEAACTATYRQTNQHFIAPSHAMNKACWCAAFAQIQGSSIESNLLPRQ
jgi:hypothetical protein